MSDTFLPGSGFDTYESQDKVLVGLDGSLAAAVAVRVLQQQGFGVVGAAVRLSPASAEAVEAARRAAKRLGIECVTLDAQALLDEETAEEDARWCEAGFTALLAAADRLGVQYIASGHFARVELDDSGESRLSPAADAEHDQSALLSVLPPDILARLILPLGDFTMRDVQELAKELKVETDE